MPLTNPEALADAWEAPSGPDLWNALRALPVPVVFHWAFMRRRLDGTARPPVPAPDDRFTLDARESRLLSATRDFEIFSTLGRPVSVLQALPSQQAVGIPSSPVRYPGGDPSLIMVPPVEQYRREYVFLTPDRYAFDYVVIVAPRTAEEAVLDGLKVASAI